MDVIALHQAGFGGAVAPLGTALTEEQLEELWRLSPAPVLCFDGDAAGGRAARAGGRTRAAACWRPTGRCASPRCRPGEDPDSLSAARARPRSGRCSTRARPLSEALFDLLREGVASRSRPSSGPRSAPGWRRRRAASPTSALASEYRRGLLDRFFAEPPGRTVRRRSAARPGARAARRARRWTARPPRRARAHPGRHPAAPSRAAARCRARLRGRSCLPRRLARLRDALIRLGRIAPKCLTRQRCLPT